MYEARENVPPAINQYKNRGNASNVIQFHSGSPQLKKYESGIASASTRTPLNSTSSTTALLPRMLGSEPATPLSIRDTIITDERHFYYRWSMARSKKMFPPQETRRKHAGNTFWDTFWGTLLLPQWTSSVCRPKERKKKKKRQSRIFRGVTPIWENNVF